VAADRNWTTGTIETSATADEAAGAAGDAGGAAEDAVGATEDAGGPDGADDASAVVADDSATAPAVVAWVADASTAGDGTGAPG
jgi:hypothetical protein